MQQVVNKTIGFVQDILDDLAEQRHRETLLKRKGIPLSAALLLARKASPRSSTYRRSLGEQGYRDWTRLRFVSEFHWETDEQNFDRFLAPLVDKTRDEDVVLDIREIRNIARSRDKLSGYQTIEQFAHAMRRGGEQESHSVLEELLESLKCSCMSENVTASNVFAKFGWDERILFDNDDGSHRLAAVKRIAIALGEKVPMRRPFEQYLLNADAVRAIADNFVLLLLPNEVWSMRLPGAISDDGVPFIPGSFRAPPCYGVGAKVLPLSRKDDLSASTASYLRSCGFIDLVEHLVEDLTVQQALTKRLA